MIYLDNNATTPVDPAVAEKMCVFLKHHYGNPSSLYPLGREVKEIVNQARESIAKAIGAQRSEIFFTGSGTEADNWAIRGVLDACPHKGEIITSAIEHPAVLHLANDLERKGTKVTYVPVDRDGLLDLDFLREAITPQTALISIMQANNEIGTIQPIETVVGLAREKGIAVHTDAVQSFGKIDIDVARLGVDLLTISAHKQGDGYPSVHPWGAPGARIPRWNGEHNRHRRFRRSGAYPHGAREERPGKNREADRPFEEGH
jgi:cysteine desulfurase